MQIFLVSITTETEINSGNIIHETLAVPEQNLPYFINQQLGTIFLTMLDVQNEEIINITFGLQVAPRITDPTTRHSFFR